MLDEGVSGFLGKNPSIYISELLIYKHIFCIFFSKKEWGRQMGFEVFKIDELPEILKYIRDHE